MKIVQLFDGRGMAKYPELERHVSKTGIIVGGYWTHNKLPRIFRDQYLYQVAIDDERQRATVPEDAIKVEIEGNTKAYLIRDFVVQ